MSSSIKYYMAVVVISYLVWVLLPENTRLLTVEESGKQLSALLGYVNLEYFKDEYFGYLEYFKNNAVEYFKTLK